MIDTVIHKPHHYIGDFHMSYCYQLTNGFVFWENNDFQRMDVWLYDGRIQAQKPRQAAAYEVHTVDCTDCYLIPGLIDTHLHGCAGADLSDGDFEGIERICEYELRHGITTVCLATMTLPPEQLIQILKTAYTYFSARDEAEKNGIYTKAADLAGVYLEGPFFSNEKAGAQRRDCLLNPDISLYNRLEAVAPGLIKILALAPELPGASEFIQAMTSRASSPVLSIGHTTCSGEEAAVAFSLGCSRITHLFNGMQNPYALIDAATKSGSIYAELICDGVHNSPERIHDAFACFGDHHLILISDSMRATGLGDGTYLLGGQPVTVHGKEALLSTGNKAGSVSNLYDCFLQALALGLPFPTVIRAATFHPAKALHMEDSIGQLKYGTLGNLLVLTKDYQLRNIFFHGHLVH